MEADLGQRFDLDHDLEQVRGVNVTMLLLGHVSKTLPCYARLIAPLSGVTAVRVQGCFGE